MFVMDVVSYFQQVNLLAIMLELMDKVVKKKHGKHGFPYGFLLKKVFEFFRVPLSWGITSSSKHK